MMRFVGTLIALGVLVSLSGCDWMPGNPKNHEQHLPPAKISDPVTLYKQNCRGCHGDQAEPSSSISIVDPLYLSILPKEQMRNIIANGVHKTLMPAFAMEKGGALTDAQIDILVEYIYKQATGSAPADAPNYSAALGDATRGGQIIAQNSAAFMNTMPQTPEAAATGFAAPAFLGLSSDQYLRTLMIVGRPELGFADYRTRIPGQVMTNQDVSDVVAWLVAQRKNEFGAPLVPATTPQP